MARIKGTRFDDRLHGTRHGDSIIGRGGHDVLNGRAGNDKINGGGGNDKISGDHGADVLIGGPGFDEFKFKAGDGFFVGGSRGDIVKDYLEGVDKFDVPVSVMGGVSGAVYSGPEGAGLIVTYYDNATPAGSFLVIGYGVGQFSLDDFI
jgi:Ca2+-binding RTX toxin-like protein